MTRTLLLWCLLLLVSCSKKLDTRLIDQQDQVTIMGVMEAQETAWNKGDLEAFMEGYWKSDQLQFIGSKGLTYGWAKTLDNYKKSYPTKEIMGTLKFDIISLERMNSTTYYMVGKYTLYRKSDTPSGHFTLVWEKKDGNWLITSDHSS